MSPSKIVSLPSRTLSLNILSSRLQNCYQVTLRCQKVGYVTKKQQFWVVKVNFSPYCFDVFFLKIPSSLPYNIVSDVTFNFTSPVSFPFRSQENISVNVDNFTWYSFIQMGFWQSHSIYLPLHFLQQHVVSMFSVFLTSPFVFWWDALDPLPSKKIFPSLKGLSQSTVSDTITPSCSQQSLQYPLSWPNSSLSHKHFRWIILPQLTQLCELWFFIIVLLQVLHLVLGPGQISISPAKSKRRSRPLCLFGPSKSPFLSLQTNSDGKVREFTTSFISSL